jgi:hypothetical protein
MSDHVRHLAVPATLRTPSSPLPSDSARWLPQPTPRVAASATRRGRCDVTTGHRQPDGARPLFFGCRRSLAADCRRLRSPSDANETLNDPAQVSLVPTIHRFRDRRQMVRHVTYPGVRHIASSAVTIAAVRHFASTQPNSSDPTCVLHHRFHRGRERVVVQHQRHRLRTRRRVGARWHDRRSPRDRLGGILNQFGVPVPDDPEIYRAPTSGHYHK